MTDQELRQLDAQVHEAFFGEKVTYGIAEMFCGYSAFVVPYYTKYLAAAWTVDREGWSWTFSESETGVDVWLGFPPDCETDYNVEFENGDKPRAYCLARCKCALRALEAK